MHSRGYGPCSVGCSPAPRRSCPARPSRISTGSPSWLPFLAFEGDCYLLDLDPGERGTVGQVVFRPNVPDLDEPKAPSLTAFLARAADLIEAGHVDTRESTLVLLDLC